MRKIFCLPYDEKTVHFNLKEIGFKKFEQYVNKSIKSINIQKLLPTNSIEKYHLYRVYYQHQEWLEYDNLQVPALEWELNNVFFYSKKWVLPQHHIF